MGSGPNFQLFHERDPDAKDHFSGKPLKDFSLSNDEFEILAEMERYYPCLSSKEARFGLCIEQVEAQYYLRGLKRALDIVIETENGYQFQLKWQACLY